jgi:hypothetical protein
VENVAFPLVSVPVPRVLEPSLKVTVPLGVPPVEVTAAVKVTAVANVDGIKEEVSAVELVVCFTVWVSAEEVLVVKSVLPA